MIGATEPVTARPRWTGLGLRVVSAAVLATPVLAGVYAGPPWFTALVILAAALAGWEWARMCRLAPGWTLAGALYLAVPCGALIWMRGDDAAGMVTVFWLFAIVWAADIGAYASGSSIGGPKLAPRISPNKTWAGLVGGVLVAAAVAATFALFWEGEPGMLALWGGIVALASQGGDLVESAAKRHFGVKDSSNLIPGHGGLLDRVDALLAGAAALAVLKLTLGSSVIPWL